MSVKKPATCKNNVFLSNQKWKTTCNIFLCEIQPAAFAVLIEGLFNIGNRLLVSIDLFLKIRASIKVGQSPSEVVRVLFDHSPSHLGKHTLAHSAYMMCLFIASLYLNICTFYPMMFWFTSR